MLIKDSFSFDKVSCLALSTAVISFTAVCLSPVCSKVCSIIDHVAIAVATALKARQTLSLACAELITLPLVDVISSPAPAPAPASAPTTWAKTNGVTRVLLTKLTWPVVE